MPKSDKLYNVTILLSFVKNIIWITLKIGVGVGPISISLVTLISAVVSAYPVIFTTHVEIYRGQNFVIKLDNDKSSENSITEQVKENSIFTLGSKLNREEIIKTIY